MELPDGWNAELVAIKKAEAGQAHTTAENVGKLAVDAHRATQQAWEKIRTTYPIEHPEPTEAFATDEEAASVIVHYWLGEKVDQEWVLRSVMGFGDTHLWNEAISYAKHLTEPGSAERDYVTRASDFLFRDYRPGPGLDLLVWS